MDRVEELKQMYAEKWTSWQTRANVALQGSGGQLSIFNFLRADGIDEFTAREISAHLFEVANKKKQKRELPKKIFGTILVLVGGLILLSSVQAGISMMLALGLVMGGPMVAIGVMMLYGRVEQKRIF